MFDGKNSSWPSDGQVSMVVNKNAFYSLSVTAVFFVSVISAADIAVKLVIKSWLQITAHLKNIGTKILSSIGYICLQLQFASTEQEVNWKRTKLF